MTSTSELPKRLVWVDLEMTGLDPAESIILEIATLVTNEDLEIVAVGPELVIHATEAELSRMAPIVVEMHQKNGLTERVRASTTTLEEAEEATHAFLAQHVAEKTAPLCGNSVWKDKQFIEKYMPRVMGLLHYRIVDVSSIKELVRRWYPALPPPEKSERHRALDDIKESIAELSHYRRNVFR